MSACLVIDHFSKYISDHFSEQNNAKQAIASRVKIEAFAQLFNHNVEHLHSDNCHFCVKAFLDSVSHSEATSVEGAGALWQNGVVEYHIGITTGHTQTMLLHAIH